MMKILLVSSTFYPDNSPRSFRTSELAKELARGGHEICLLIPDANEKQKIAAHQWHINLESDEGRKINALKRMFGDSAWARYPERICEILLEYHELKFRNWIRRAIKGKTGYDLLISIASPHGIHWGIAEYICETGIKPARVWVADCGDPFMGAKMNKVAKMPWFSYFEHRFCKTCDFISVPVKNAITAYYEKYRQKIKVIPQGFNFEDSRALARHYAGNPVPTFGYAGSLSPGKRDPRPFLSFLLTVTSQYLCTFYTNAPHLVIPFAEKSNGRIKVNPYIPRNELFGILSTMDFLVNFENETKEQTPSKLIDYYLMGRPVLSVSSRTDIPLVMDHFLKGDYSGATIFTNPDDYDIRNVALEFLKLVKHD